MTLEGRFQVLHSQNSAHSYRSDRVAVGSWEKRMPWLLRILSCFAVHYFV